MIAIFPKIAGCAMSGDIERLTCMVRQYFGDEQTYAPRLDLIKLASRIGIAVDRMAVDGKAALLAKDEKGRFEIRAVLATSLKDQREITFTMAHLLGHFFLHVQPHIARGDLTVSGSRESASPLVRYERGLVDGRTSEQDEKHDQEADAFAAALLLPAGMIKRALSKLTSPERIAEFFGVSSALLTRRLEALGLSEDEPVSFLDAERKLKNSDPSFAKTIKKTDIPTHLGASPKKAMLAEPPSSNQVKKNLAQASYKSQKISETVSDKKRSVDNPSAAADVAEPLASQSAESAEQGSAPTKGMARIRELAKRIDRSVDV